MSHPYENLPDRAFWKTAVVEADRQTFPGLYVPKLTLDRSTRVATAGSCFAQHIGRYLRMADCAVLDGEPAPRPMPDQLAQDFGYGLFSGRYGNVYTARQMLQLLQDAASGHVDPDHVWKMDDAYVDAFRPTVEPAGLETPAEVFLHRAYHLERLAQTLRKTDLFIFTLGLTEAWEDIPTGRVFPLCPGTHAGTFDDTRHRFRNFRTGEVAEDLMRVHALLQKFNPNMKMLLTVSPVPLTATASEDHVLAASTRSKSVLRAAAGDVAQDLPDVDYFPSYEIITAPASEGPWFEKNWRTVKAAGVDKVMSVFFSAHGLEEAQDTAKAAPVELVAYDDENDLVCDELLLEAFSK